MLLRRVHVSHVSNQLDLTSQYLATILIPRINRADDAYRAGSFYGALELLTDVISVMDIESLRKKDLKERLLKSRETWLVMAREIDGVSRRAKGPDSTTTWAKQDRIRNALARIFYLKYRAEVWAFLHEVGYFRMRGAATVDLEAFLDSTDPAKLMASLGTSPEGEEVDADAEDGEEAEEGAG